MKSNLKKIYDNKNNIDIYNTPKYLFRQNPIYQVNKFITNIDENLCKNLKNNLEDIIIINDGRCRCMTEYIPTENILYCNKNEGDIFGLLQVASNDRTKNNIGIIIEDEIGYGLNNGLTEIFRNEIVYNNFAYPFEATIAKALLIIDKKLITYSYFNNNGDDLSILGINIKTLMKFLDKYQDNYVELLSLYNERFIKKFNKLKTEDQNKRLYAIENKIKKLEIENFGWGYYIFNLLIEIIQKSNLKEEEKQDLFIRLYNEFEIMFKSEKFTYLNKLTQEIDKNIKVRSR